MRREDEQGETLQGRALVPAQEPGELERRAAATLRRLRRHGGEGVWRAYGLKEGLRAIFHGNLSEDAVAELLDRFCSKAQRSGLKRS